MRVIYNGCDLFAIETHEFHAEPVYDDTLTDYLYTKYSIAVTAVVNGNASVVPANPHNHLFMSYKFAGNVAGASNRTNRNPSPLVGSIGDGDEDGIAIGDPTTPARSIQIVPSRAPLTHQAVRHRLTTPRAPLYVFAGMGMEGGTPPAGGYGLPGAGAELILASPIPPYDVDCKNGPIPRLLGITMAVGDFETLLVDFSIETYVNEAVENNARPNDALLSNRWKQSHTVDADGYTTITTEGIALFRTDILYATGSSPDVDRPVLFMPIPNGFTREIDYVEGREDVSGIAYGYHDKQASVNFVAGPFVGAMQIHALHRQAVSVELDFSKSALSAYERSQSLLLNNKWLKESAKSARGRGAKPPGTVNPMMAKLGAFARSGKP